MSVLMISFLVAVIACLIVSAAAETYSWQMVQNITGAANSYFGSSITMSSGGSQLFVGSIPLSTHGSVNVYTKNPSTAQWSLFQTLVASDGIPGDQFGYSSAIAFNSFANANFAIIGANYANKAYIFMQSGSASWSQTQILSLGSVGSGANFGASVGISSSGIAFVGCPNNALGYGTVSVYGSNLAGTTWSQIDTLSSPDANKAGDAFGNAISVVTSSQNAALLSSVVSVLIGADTAQVVNSTFAPQVGAAYYFTGITEYLTASATNIWATEAPYSYYPDLNYANLITKYGRSVILAELDTGIVGAMSAPYADSPAGVYQAGAVYVYASPTTMDLGLPVTSLYASHTGAGADYGWSMAFDPSMLTFMVGAPFQNTTTSGTSVCGTVYTYLVSDNTSFPMSCPFSLDALAQMDSPGFGTTVAVAGNASVVGAPNANQIFFYEFVVETPSSSDDDNLDSASVYGAIVGGIVGSALIVGGIYYVATGAGAAAASSGAGATGSAGVAVGNPMSTGAGSAAAHHANNI